MSVCPNCGTPCQPSHRFCSNCGALLHARRELKHVTVLLADLCDSTATVVQSGAEDGQAYLDLAFEQMSAAVAAYGGTQVQWRGDELLALFGAPIAQEDHALRACLAASAMIEGMKACAQAQMPMSVRIGIHSGEVIAGPGSGELSGSYRVDGAPVHLASRIERLAPPGSAYVSGSTMRLVAGLVQARALGVREVRGFEAPVEIHELAVGPDVSAAVALARRQFLGPFVGRGRELDALATWAERVRRGSLHTLGIRGDAGVGKSRLLAEACTRMRGLGFATVSVAVRGYDSQASYRLVADIVRALAAAPQGKAEGGPDAPAPDAGDEPAEAQALTDLLGERDPGEAWRLLTPLQRRERIANAFVSLMREQTQRQPLVLVVEDAAFADRGSLRLLESLATRLSSAPLLLLLSYRQDFLHRWADAPWFDELALGPLSPAEASQLANHLLGSDPSIAAMRDVLLERAGGNPLFLEQMVLTLLDDGSLLGPPGACRSAPTAAALTVPASIMTIIGARVDRLPVGAKASLEAAAVLGEPLEAPLVAAVRQIDAAEAERHLQQAVAGGLAVVTPSPIRISYAFRTGLVQDAVLATMTRARRRQLHRAAFEALSTRVDAAPPDAGTLAHHAFQGELWVAAANQAQKAMARSISRSENKDALRIFELGLDAARRIEPESASLPCELALRLEALGALLARSQFDQIVINLERAETITNVLGDPRRQAGVALQLAVTHWACGSYRRGLAVATRAGVAAAAAGSRGNQMAALMGRMMHNHALGRYADASADAALIERDYAAELLARRLLPGWAVIASVNLAAFVADIELWRGDLAAAQAACDCGYQELKAQDHSFSRALLDFSQAVVLLAQQRSAEAAELLRTTLELCRAHEVITMQPAVLAHLSGALAQSGRVEQALALLEPAIAQHNSRAGGRYNEYYFPYFLGVALHYAGRADDAVAAARQACDAAASFEEVGHQARALRLLARLEALAGRDLDAATHLAESRALAQQCGMDWPTLEAACEVALEAPASPRGHRLAPQDHA